MADSLWRRVLFPSRRAIGEDVPRVLVVTASAWDQEFYRSLRERGEWNLEITSSAPEALRLLKTDSFAIVLCDRDLPGWDWREVLARIVETSPRSCFLLSSRVSDEYLWREVVMHGGYDVLAKPLESDVVVQALQRAWYYWRAAPPAATTAD